MKAWKFLAEGAVGPFTGYRWPPPGGAAGPWVRAPEGAPGDRWIHACRLDDLPYWLGAELWELELVEPVVRRRHQLASPRARLVTRVDGWTRDAGLELARACAERARALAARAPQGAEALAEGYLSTVLARLERVAAAAFATALLAELVGGPGARDAERGWQSRWLAARLHLSAA